MIRKVAMVLAAMVLNTQALTDVTVPKTWAARDTLTRGNLNANNDTVYTRVNQLNDSLEVNFVRFTDVKDTTFQKVKCDSIRSNPDVDSIRGNPRIDTLTVTSKITCDSLTVSSAMQTGSGGTFKVTVIKGTWGDTSGSGYRYTGVKKNRILGAFGASQYSFAGTWYFNGLDGGTLQPELYTAKDDSIHVSSGSANNAHPDGDTLNIVLFHY